MSIRASEYARSVLEEDTELGTAPRLVFMLLAERCNGRTSTTYTGDWLASAAGLHTGTVGRAINALITAGYLTCRKRKGLASVVTFPVDAYLSTTRAETSSTRALTSSTPHASARVPRDTNYLPPPTHAPECVCDGTGWLYDEARGGVFHCPVRPPEDGYGAVVAL